MSEDAASHRRAPLCTSSPHGGQISGYETVSQERLLGGVGGAGREEAGEAGGSAGAAVNQQINSQTDQSPPQYPRAHGRTCLRPVPGMLESNWERRGNHCSQAAFVSPDLPMQQKKKQTNSRTHLHIQGYQASSSRLIMFFSPSLPAPLTHSLSRFCPLCHS